MNPRKTRVNACSYEPTISSLLDIQFGRELEEEEVLRINLIQKQRATRYVAASEEEWLYPEQRLLRKQWSELDDDWFLLPHPYKVPFSGGISVGYKDRSSWAMDEYGRSPGDQDYQNKEQHQREWDRHLEAKWAWADKKEGKSVAHVDEFRHDGIYEKLAADDLERYRKRRRENRKK